MTTPQPQDAHAIVLYDGVCNLCSGAIRFIAERDPRGYFRFGALQSDAGRTVLARHGLPPEEVKTIVLVEDDRAFTQSTAVLKIARHLRQGWPLLALFRAVPRPLRDAVYRFVAARRYRWFGQKTECELPPVEWKTRFL
jgi:predicted DCC family thiol-disulfide oxidoreductase YuxK